MTYKFRPLALQDLDQLTALLSSCFEIKNRSPRRLIRWKFFSQDIADLVAYVAEKDDTIVSFYCNKNLSVTWGSHQYESGICLDMATAPEHRGQGLISALSKKVYQDVEARNYDFSFGFSNQSGLKVDQHATGYGYHVVGEMKKYYKGVIRNKETVYSLVPRDRLDGVMISVGDQFEIVGKPDYLTWRYCEKPHNRYEIFSLRHDNAESGVVILRKFGNWRVEILKIIASTRELDHQQVLNAVNNFALERHYRMIVIHVLPNKLWTGLLSDSHFFSLPRGRDSYYLTVKSHGDHGATELLLSPENWHLTGGDIV